MLVVALAVSAQVVESPKENARPIKLDEIGPMNDCDFSTRVSRFFSEMSNKPIHQAYIINYDSASIPAGGYIHRRERIITDRIAFRNFDRSRITLVRGGYRVEEATELWLVPPGTENPEPSKTVSDPKVPESTTILYASRSLGFESAMAEFLFDSVKALDGKVSDERESDIDDKRSDDDEERFRWADVGIAVRIANIKGSSGVIFFYADDKRYDVTKLREFVERGRDLLVKNASIPKSRLSIEFGGYRDDTEVDFWFVPAGGASPMAQPYNVCAPDR